MRSFPCCALSLTVLGLTSPPALLSDYECFTLLAQYGDVQALQVLNAAGEWIQASPKPGTFVVNIGDQLQRITSMSASVSRETQI